MSEFAPAQRRRREFHRRQNERMGVAADARPLVPSNALSHWFATGVLLDGLHPDNRALIEEIRFDEAREVPAGEPLSADRRARLRTKVAAALIAEANLGGAVCRAHLAAEALILAERVVEAVLADLDDLL